MTETVAANIVQIPFKSELHKRVMGAFKSRLKMARDAQGVSRLKKWREAEDTFMMYVKESDEDSQRNSNRKNGKPQYTTIAIPYSYAMLLTAHTYYTSVFLSRNPVFQVSGRHGEAENATMAVEALLDYQIQAGGATVPLYVWLLDPGKYGHGILGHYWDKEIIPITQYVEETPTFFGMPIPGAAPKRVQKTVEAPGYVGNKMYNVRPHDFFNDPRYPLYRFQEGEFVIVYDMVGWNQVMRQKANQRFYNIAELKAAKMDNSSERDMGSPRTELPGANMNDLLGDDGNTPTKTHLHYFHWEIVPSELGLGKSNRPEKWVFTIGNESVIVSAQPLGLAHGKYPFDVLTNEVDGYSSFNRSMFEIMDPLNKTMEWLFNSHFFNVRAALNNQFLADPTKIVMKDIEDPNPGKLIRLKPAAYGQDVRQFLMQLPVQDITRANLSDSEVVAQLAQRIGGVNDSVMGMVNQGRKTATEVRTSTSFGVNRLKTMCEWFSAVGFAPLTYKMIASSQQLYDLDRKYRIVGDVSQWGEKYMQVTPDMIQGVYDFVPVDGTMPVDRYAQANLWQQMLGQLRNLPQIAAAYDLPKVFAFVAQLAGLKNISQFRVQVVPDANALAMGQSGQAVPVRVNPTEPGQIPGMGQTT